jgi:hypothetical protein
VINNGSTDFAAEAAAGRRAAVYIEFNPLLNPHIDRAALLAMGGELDERSFEIEVLGMFRGPKDAVAYNWIRFENEIPSPGPELLDVTELFLSSTARAKASRTIVGPRRAAVPVHRRALVSLLRAAGSVPDARQRARVDRRRDVLEGGDEVDFCGALSDAGSVPSRR